MRYLHSQTRVALLAASMILAACGIDPDEDGPLAGGADTTQDASAGGDTTPDTAPDAAGDTSTPDSGVDSESDAADASADSDAATDADAPDADAADAETSDTADAADLADVPSDVPTDIPTDTPADTPSDSDAAAVAWVEIGVGESTIQTTDGAETTIAEGFQGGFHVWGGFRGSGFPADGPTPSMEMVARDASGTTVAGGYFEFPWEPTDAGVRVSGITVFLVASVIPEAVAGETWELCGTVTSGDLVLSDCITIVVGCCDWRE